jgi:regulator of cell morphogenesis and NO signaling
MKMISEYMRTDHQALFKLFDEFRAINNKDPKKAKKLFSEFASGLRKHMACEEQVLFPLFEEKTQTRSLNSSSTSLLRQDHLKIRDILNAMEADLGNHAKTGELKKQLAAILSDHEKTETSIIYPWLDQVIEEDAARIIIAGMKNVVA